METNNLETARLEARIPLQLKENVLLASKMSGQSLTNYIISALNEAIHKTVAEQNTIKICIQDMQILEQAMQKESSLPKRLVQAYHDHREMIEHE